MRRIYTAKYLLPGNAPPLVGGALLDLDGRIGEVGLLASVRRSHPGVEVVDLGEGILLPALVNAHTHLELSDFPRWAQRAGETATPDSFVDWILQVIRVKRRVNQRDFAPSLKRGIEQSLAAGTGAVGDILSHFPSRKAYRRSPLRGRIFLETLGQDPALTRQLYQGVCSVLAEQQVGNLQLALSPHSPYTLSGEYLAELYRKCWREQVACSTHLAESAAEVDLLARGDGDLQQKLYPFIGWQGLLPTPLGLPPVDYLAAKGGLFGGQLLVHGVQLTSDEIKKIAEAGSHLVLCPRSNARLGVGKAPLAELLRQGVGLSLGTDSLASCDSLSIWDEIAFAREWFAGQVDPPGLLQMATQGGARALGLGDQLGLLASGYRSSFQLLRPERLPNVSEIFEHLCTAGRTAEVEKLYLDGRSVLPA